jgi:hypothetical protein
MKKVLLATLLAFIGLAVVSDASAWFNRGGRCGSRCGYSANTCERPCAQSRCANETPVAVTRVEEKPCGPAPCCLTAVQVPANLVRKVEYEWECPTGCTVNPGMDGAY